MLLSILLYECFHEISRRVNAHYTKTLSMGRLALFLASAPNKLELRLHVIMERAVSQSAGLGISASVSFILVCLCDAVCYTPAPTSVCSDRSVLSITQQDTELTRRVSTKAACVLLRRIHSLLRNTVVTACAPRPNPIPTTGRSCRGGDASGSDSKGLVFKPRPRKRLS